MSGNDLVFNETAVNYIVDDVERAASKLREGGTEMSDLVEHELIEWTGCFEIFPKQLVGWARLPGSTLTIWLLVMRQ